MRTESAGFEPAGGGIRLRLSKPLPSARLGQLSRFRIQADTVGGTTMRPSCGYGEGWIRTTVPYGPDLQSGAIDQLRDFPGMGGMSGSALSFRFSLLR